MRAKLFTAAALVSIILAGCDVTDPIYETSHPDYGKITLSTDWSATNIATLPASGCAVRVGECSETLTGVSQTLDYLFEPGDYTIYVHSTADGIAVSGTMATTDYTGSLGWLYTGVQAVEVAKDTDHACTVAMAQQIRELTLIIEPTGGTIDRIATITGTLSGVAGSLDFADGTHSAPSSAALSFSKITSGADAGKWTVTVRLLGVTGAQQKLTGTITFTDGMPAHTSLDSDLTSVLAGFNADKKTPLMLGGSVVETPTELAFTSIITSWEPVNAVQGNAEMD